MPHTTTLHIGTANDLGVAADQIRALIHETINDTYPADTAAAQITQGYNEQRFARLIADRTWFAAVADDELVGVSAVHLDGTTAHISATMVARRGQGIGRKLTTACLAWAVGQDAEKIVAHTHPWNAASLANLTRIGFQRTATHPDTWTGHGEVIELSLTLPPF